ncbi:hypothetical protein VP01_64g1 [Puccinia sorghi]|uniref:Uncharacterized protein n=1 Tax=Puccinia sorghi TaxID=27349 RepID=A0A0L6UHP4_9BASI|nr:hypothetical protein VP01_64g1 [Puccinia sorghi]
MKQPLLQNPTLPSQRISPSEPTRVNSEPLLESEIQEIDEEEFLKIVQQCRDLASTASNLHLPKSFAEVIDNSQWTSVLMSSPKPTQPSHTPPPLLHTYIPISQNKKSTKPTSITSCISTSNSFQSNGNEAQNDDQNTHRMEINPDHSDSPSQHCAFSPLSAVPSHAKTNEEHGIQTNNQEAKHDSLAPNPLTNISNHIKNFTIIISKPLSEIIVGLANTFCKLSLKSQLCLNTPEVLCPPATAFIHITIEFNYKDWTKEIAESSSVAFLSFFSSSFQLTLDFVHPRTLIWTLQKSWCNTSNSPPPQKLNPLQVKHVPCSRITYQPPQANIQWAQAVVISILIISDKTRTAPTIQSDPKSLNQHVIVPSLLGSPNRPMLMPSHNMMTHKPEAEHTTPQQDTTSQQLGPAKPPPMVQDALEEIKKNKKYIEMMMSSTIMPAHSQETQDQLLSSHSLSYCRCQRLETINSTPSVIVLKSCALSMKSILLPLAPLVQLRISGSTLVAISVKYCPQSLIILMMFPN